MMNQAVFVFLLVTVDLMTKMASAIDFNAYSKNLNDCMFTAWKNADVLSALPTCNAANLVPLCYAPNKRNPALFVSCYSKTSKIPVYTAHIVKLDRGARPKPVWHNDVSMIGRCNINISFR